MSEIRNPHPGEVFELSEGYFLRLQNAYDMDPGKSAASEISWRGSDHRATKGGLPSPPAERTRAAHQYTEPPPAASADARRPTVTEDSEKDGGKDSDRHE